GQVACLGGVGVADGAHAVGDGCDDTGGALRGLAALDRPFAGGLIGPHVAGCLVEGVGEVLGGARDVGGVHDGDRVVGRGGAIVQLGDCRVVPVGDVTGEDAREHRGGEVQVRDALDVEDDGDRGDVDGEVVGDRLGGAQCEGAGDVLLG